MDQRTALSLLFLFSKMYSSSGLMLLEHSQLWLLLSMKGLCLMNTGAGTLEVVHLYTQMYRYPHCLNLYLYCITVLVFILYDCTTFICWTYIAFPHMARSSPLRAALPASVKIWRKFSSYFQFSE